MPRLMPRLWLVLILLFAELLIHLGPVQSDEIGACPTGFGGPSCEACVWDAYSGTCHTKCQVTLILRVLSAIVNIASFDDRL